MHYRPDIDGLRAFAVLSVIFHHAGLPGFGGGYIGVDVFFVISGYLITAILLRELVEGRFSILRFYERRARRILPALFVVLLACLPPALLWLRPDELRAFGLALGAVILFVPNILFWRQIDYFAADAELNPLLHTWSLAIEEQFYVIFPLALALLWRLGRKAPVIAMLLVALLSLALSEWLSRQSPGANFYLLPTRAWELLAGSLAAWVHLRRPDLGQGRGGVLWSWIGLALILVPVPLYSDQTPFPSLYALPPILGAVLIMLCGRAKAGGGWLLRLPPMVAIGWISYSAYLWHQPLFAFARLRSPEPLGHLVMIGLVLVTLLLATLSWRFVEQPFRKGAQGLLPRRPQIFAASLAGAVAFLACAALLVLGQGLPTRTAPSGTRFADLALDERLRAVRGGRTGCRKAPLDTPACAQPPAASVLLWGDSFAMHLGPALRVMAGTEAVAELTKPVCSPLLGLAVVAASYPEPWSKECIAFNDAVLDYLRRTPGLATVVLSSPLGVMDFPLYQRDGQTLTAFDEKRAAVKTALLATADAIRAAGRKVVFVSPTPQTGFSLSDCPVRRLTFGTGYDTDCSFPIDSLSPRNQRAYDLLRDVEPNLPVLWLSDVLCHDGRCQTVIDDTILYRDHGHFTELGSRKLGEVAGLWEQIQQLAARQP